MSRLLSQRFLAYPVFYGWNVLLLFTIITVEVSEGMLLTLISSVIESYTPISYLVYAAILFLVPVVSFILGIKFFGRNPKKLLQWFYGFEVPLGFLAMFRIFGFKELTPDIGLWFSLMVFAVLGYGAYVLWEHKMNRLVRQVALIFRVVAGVLFASFLILYAIPLLAIFIQSIPEWDFRDILEVGFMGFLVLLFAVFTGTLFFLSPTAFIVYYIIDGVRDMKLEIRNHSNFLISGVLGVSLVVFCLYPRTQPQVAAFALVEDWKNKSLSDGDALEHESDIKDGLLNAYLNKYRYLGHFGEFRIIEKLYDEAFNFYPTAVGSVHGLLLSPFVYEGEYNDKQKAALDYERIFDEPIERAEREPIIDAMSATFQPRTVEAGILNIDQKQVEVTDRDIKFNEKSPGTVEVIFHERYLNRTFQRQEIFYYFSLPQNAVITGLWLSNDDDRLYKYPYQVAPRGAAQQTYKEIKQRNADPALLEQVGPYQYRLRVFPIPAREYRFYRRGRNNDETEEKEFPMHITMRMLCRTSETGAIELPKLTEKRNVFWEEGLAGCAEDQWFPEANDVFTPSKPNEVLEVNGLKVDVTPLSDLPQRKPEYNFVICVDGSYSMNRHVEHFNAFWESFPYKDNSTLYILRGDKWVKLNKTEPQLKDLIGINDPLLAIHNISKKFPESQIVWVTDKGNYELLANDSARQGFDSKTQIDIIHLNGYAAIYEDALLESVIRSGGQVYPSGGQWIKWAKAEFDRKSTFWQEGNQLITFSGESDSSEIVSNQAEAFWASRYVMAMNKTISGNSDTTTLDKLHRLALEHSFVSPLSSMICLVNERQRELLEEKMNGSDRYEREVENGKMSGNGVLNVTGVPEPHEWVLIFFGFGLLLILYKDKLLMKLLELRRK